MNIGLLDSASQQRTKVCSHDQNLRLWAEVISFRWEGVLTYRLLRLDFRDGRFSEGEEERSVQYCLTRYSNLPKTSEGSHIGLKIVI